MTYTKKGFSLVELMVVVAIIAILTAIALPMYSTARNKAKANAAIGAAQGFRGPLTSWYDENGSFANLNFDPAQNRIYMTNLEGATVNLGVDLPANRGLTWSTETISAGTSETFVINFLFENETCHPCSGRWCITCELDEECSVQIDMNDADYAGRTNPLADLGKGLRGCP